MKAVKGKLLKKLKTIKPIVYLKQQERIFQVNALDGFIPTFSKNPSFDPQSRVECECMNQEVKDECFVNNEEADVIDVAALMRDLEEEEEEEMEVDDENWDDKENVGPPRPPPRKVQEESRRCFDGNLENSVKRESSDGGLRKQVPLSEIDISSFRRPDLNSCSLFDPNLLAAFEQAVKEHARLSEAERQARISFERRKLEAEVEARMERESCERRIQEETERETKIEETKAELGEEEPPFKTRRIDDEDYNHLLRFEERCPPGGSDAVVVYTTTLQGIRKTFQDCNSVRFLLESFRVAFLERDVSMHMEFREELWRVMERKITPPRVFIRGRYIGGAEEVIRMHEQGKLKKLFEGIPKDQRSGSCEGCGGVRFVVCFNCSGSQRVISDDGFSTKCHNCNENGLIICPLCC